MTIDVDWIAADDGGEVQYAGKDIENVQYSYRQHQRSAFHFGSCSRSCFEIRGQIRNAGEAVIVYVEQEPAVMVREATGVCLGLERERTKFAKRKPSREQILFQ